MEEQKVQETQQQEKIPFNQDIVMTADLITKLNIYIKTYGSSMRTLRQNQPEVWKNILQSTKIAYSKDPYADNIIIEMLAANAIEYQESLLDGKVSPFSSQLNQFALSNNLLFR